MTLRQAQDENYKGGGVTSKERMESRRSGERVFRVFSPRLNKFWEDTAITPEGALIRAGLDMQEETARLEIREYTDNGGWKKCKEGS